MKNFFEWLGKLPAAVAKTTVVVVVIASVIILFKQLNSSAYLVEPIQVPGSLSEKGYTAEVTTLWIVDKMLDIQRQATTRKEDQTIVPEGQSFDMEVPGSGFTLSTIGQALRESLGIPKKTISGEVVSAATGYELRLRLSGGSGYRQVAVADHDVAALINAAAESAVHLVAPFIFASYLHASGRTGELVTVIDYCLRHQPVGEHKWAYNLRGIMLAEQQDWDAAIESYEQALKSEPRFALAYFNWANALAGKQQYEQARAKLAEAVEIDSKLRGLSKEAEASWKALEIASAGHALRRDAGRRDEAIGMFQRALELDPRQTSALQWWGQALLKKKPMPDYAGAADKFAQIERIDGDDTDTQIYIRWGEALAGLGDKDGAISKYEAAIATNPQGYEKILRPRIKTLETD